MSERFFDHDPLTGVTETFIWSDDDTFTLKTQQDVEPILEAAKRRFNDFTGSERWNPEGEYVGTIPAVFLDQMMRDGSIRDPKAVMRFFEQNPAFKSRPGSLL